MRAASASAWRLSLACAAVRSPSRRAVSVRRRLTSCGLPPAAKMRLLSSFKASASDALLAAIRAFAACSFAVMPSLLFFKAITAFARLLCSSTSLPASSFCLTAIALCVSANRSLVACTRAALRSTKRWSFALLSIASASAIASFCSFFRSCRCASALSLSALSEATAWSRALMGAKLRARGCSAISARTSATSTASNAFCALSCLSPSPSSTTCIFTTEAADSLALAARVACRLRVGRFAPSATTAANLAASSAACARSCTRRSDACARESPASATSISARSRAVRSSKVLR
mmetsp:Transcript_40413/g.99823  ORF Transcript_40413/g.99823 Transcript_40413/m.99823 type:complete len:293 (+) Transcript_40413:4528-5406(+)